MKTILIIMLMALSINASAQKAKNKFFYPGPMVRSQNDTFKIRYILFPDSTDGQQFMKVEYGYKVTQYDFYKLGAYRVTYHYYDQKFKEHDDWFVLRIYVDVEY